MLADLRVNTCELLSHGWLKGETTTLTIIYLNMMLTRFRKRKIVPITIS